MKYTQFLVEWYDQKSGRWGRRMFTSRKRAQGYMDGIHGLLKESGDPQPIVVMKFLDADDAKPNNQGETPYGASGGGWLPHR